MSDSRTPERKKIVAKDQMGDDLKAYFVGSWSSIVGWGLSERVSDNQEF